jgi:hypothetical protein
MADALSPSDASVPVVGVEGLAAVGKTTLAVHVGHAVVANFPDGQLFVDLGGASEPLAELLRGVGVPDAGLPESFSERVALWRTFTTGRRLLIVLDEARDAEQVRPLLPGPGGSAVMITAWQRLYGLAYVHWLKLGGLGEDDSVALLERLIGVDRVAPGAGGRPASSVVDVPAKLAPPSAAVVVGTWTQDRRGRRAVCRYRRRHRDPPAHRYGR